jgi:hypothetical protein
VAFVPRQLQRLHALGTERFLENVRSRNRDPILYSNRLFTQPAGLAHLRLVLSKVWQKIGVVVSNRLFDDQWQLMIDFRESPSTSLWRYRRLVPPPGSFWADPHALAWGDQHVIFLEEYLESTQRGRIAVMELRGDLTYSDPVPVIEEGYHLSYPHVFEHAGTYYMIPESASNASVDLYQCEQFPYKWKRVMTLMHGIQAYDTTVLFHDGRWWLFANVLNQKGASSWDELCLYSSSQLLSQDWEPHPMNPVISDCRTARPAGAIFTVNGGLYRPSQDCSTRYGYGLNFSRIKELSRDSYEEVLVNSARPNWATDVLGTHTFSQTGKLNVVDVLVRSPRFWRRKRPTAPSAANPSSSTGR